MRIRLRNVFACPRIVTVFFQCGVSLLLAGALFAQASPKPKPSAATSRSTQAAAADRLAAKLQHIQQNGLKEHPDQTPTVLTEEEINAYFAEGRVKLPAGVKSVKFGLAPDTINGSARVDFDEIKAGRSSSNPLLGLFSGVHDVRSVAHADGSGGMGKVHIESVALDDSEIPRFVLELFVSKFLTPKYPNVGLDSTFKLPSKVDLAMVGEHKLTVTQK
jgi:hypothetical protein